jgi:hypothetical protein
MPNSSKRLGLKRLTGAGADADRTIVTRCPGGDHRALIRQNHARSETGAEIRDASKTGSPTARVNQRLIPFCQ